MRYSNTNKEMLWNLLEKYDSDKGMVNFCNSLSNIIQGKETEKDLISLIEFNNIDESDMDIINKSVNLKSVLY